MGVRFRPVAVTFWSNCHGKVPAVFLLAFTTSAAALGSPDRGLPARALGLLVALVRPALGLTLM